MSGEGSGTPFPKVRAVYDYAAQSEKELSFRRGDLITIFDIVDDHWWEGGVDGREGYVPAAYVEHQPSWMSSGQTEASSDTPPALDSATTANTPLARAVASAAAAANSGGGDDGRKSPSPTGTPASHRAAYGLPADRPNLAKALKAHQTKAKHEVATTPNTGLQEFKRQFTQIKKKATEPKAEESELAMALRKARETTDASTQRQKELDSMPELEKKFKQRMQQQQGAAPPARP